MKKGIDLSHHNIVTDYKKAFCDIDFVIIRAGYGKDKKQIDKKLVENVNNAIKYKKPFGLYWYSYAETVADAKKEAIVCYDILNEYLFKKGIKNNFPVFYDIEDINQIKNQKTYNSSMVTTFCDYLKSKGIKTGFYTYHYFAKDKLNLDLLSAYDFWYANLSINDDNTVNKYSIWQYTNKKIIEGIQGYVDCNKMSDDYYNRYINKSPTEKALEILEKIIGKKPNDGKTIKDVLEILQGVIDSD